MMESLICTLLPGGHRLEHVVVKLYDEESNRIRERAGAQCIRSLSAVGNLAHEKRLSSTP